MSGAMNEILAAFDELDPEREQPAPAEEEEGEQEPDEAEEEQESEPDVAETEGEPEPEEEEDSGDEEEEEPEQEEVEVTAEHDPAVQAFLARYGGDVDKALQGAVELEVLLGRQSNEVGAARQRAAELEQILAEQQALTGTTWLTAEQQQWVEEAVTSGNPRAYVQGAMQEGEFDLARAVVREWSREDPYEAMRVGQVVESGAARMQAPPMPEPLDKGVLLSVLASNYPEMAGYWGQMETMIAQLGPNHPTVQDARSEDVEQAARGIVNLYEIARASSATVREAKDQVKRKQRKAADEAREGAVVSSAGTSRAASDNARSTIMVTPGLTLDQLDEEFEAASK